MEQRVLFKTNLLYRKKLNRSLIFMETKKTMTFTEGLFLRYHNHQVSGEPRVLGRGRVSVLWAGCGWKTAIWRLAILWLIILFARVLLTAKDWNGASSRVRKHESRPLSRRVRISLVASNFEIAEICCSNHWHSNSSLSEYPSIKGVNLRQWGGLTQPSLKFAPR